MHFSNSALLVILGYASAALADSGYAATCNSFELYQPGLNINDPSYYVDFGADCREEIGIYTVDNTVNLSWCFENLNGVLIAKEEYVLPISYWNA